MKMVIFGLTVSSSWGNGHATLWRGLIRALTDRGWTVEFFERDVPYYAGARDLTEIPGGELILYPDWESVRSRAEAAVVRADVAIVTSYCPDGRSATKLIAGRRGPLRLFYDLDTPVTLAMLDRGETPSAIGDGGLADFDLVLSYTGGRALRALCNQLGARRVAPLYGHVDPAHFRPATADEQCRADLSFIGTYAADRQDKLEALLVAPAQRCGGRRFIIAGAQYPHDFPWAPNIFFLRHLPPHQHPGFYASAALTLNITRGPMAEAGWCPSGRLFEAAACGATIISDQWPGIEEFFEPGREILIARTTEDVMAALDRPPAELREIGAGARRRVLSEHTSAKRADRLMDLLNDLGRPSSEEGVVAA